MTDPNNCNRSAFDLLSPRSGLSEAARKTEDLGVVREEKKEETE